MVLRVMMKAAKDEQTVRPRRSAAGRTRSEEVQIGRRSWRRRTDFSVCDTFTNASVIDIASPKLK